MAATDPTENKSKAVNIRDLVIAKALSRHLSRGLLMRPRQPKRR